MVARWLGPALFALLLGAGGGSTAQTLGTGILVSATVNGQQIPCAVEPDGVRVCHADGTGPASPDRRVRSFDGVPLSLYVTLPPTPPTGPDGRYPLVIQSHGWGEPPKGPDDGQYGGPTARQWAKEGYAVMQLAARGWGNSCGNLGSRLLNLAGCAKGYVRRDDFRYEIRDAQHVAGLLVDEGLADPGRIGAHGESYGAGASLGLATLNDRVMNADGTLAPWVSPRGTPLHIAAAAPFAGWSDVTYMAPNGRTPDPRDPAASLRFPVGVQKMSINRGLFMVGISGSYYPPPGASPDLMLEFAVAAAGEPYEEPLARGVVEAEARYHSPYHLLAGSFGRERRAPAPLFLANGFTDDVFWADQVLVYYDLLRALYPSASVELLFGDIGHQRAQSKAADLVLMSSRVHAFLAYYLKGAGSRPDNRVTVLTQTCPKTAPSGGPYVAASWEALHDGARVFRSDPGQTILSTVTDPDGGRAFDPVTGPGSCATAPALRETHGIAVYQLPPAAGDGFTLLGSPTVTADLKVSGEFAYIAARLVDVDPATHSRTLISRGAYRIDPRAPNGRQNFTLSANAWRFAPGHVAELELLGQDAPFLRPSNGAFGIVVSKLSLTLPVREALPDAPVRGGREATILPQMAAE